MPAHNILVAVVDGLRASALGAYGNTSYPTPAFDRFAAESFLLDWCYATSTDLATIYQAFWQHGGTSLPRQFKSRGYETSLVTDEAILMNFPAATDFDHCLELSDARRHSARATRATDTAHTSLARWCATAADVVASTTAETPRLVWLHARGMYGPWDAPLDLQRPLLDEGDPPPLDSIAPPDLPFAAADDPDAAFRHGCAYAAQAMVLDECWDSLIAALESAGGADRWLVALVGARGFPLGEHGRIGGVDPRMYGEQLHVPLLIRFPGAAGRLARGHQLTTHADLAPTLLNASAAENLRALCTSAPAAWRDALVSTSADGHRSIRTADWCLRRSPHPGLDETSLPCGNPPSSGVELYVRPDDRWEANDVAKLCPDVTEALTRRLDETS